MIDLKPFCSREKRREILLQPWSLGVYTFATDGRLLIRVERRDDVPEGHEPLHLQAAAFFHEQPWSGVFIPLPEIPPLLLEECQACKGADCESCQGTGKEAIMQRVQWGEQVVSSEYLRLVATLPGIVGDPHLPHGLYRGVPLKFDGGLGLLAPMKPKKG